MLFYDTGPIYCASLNTRKINPSVTRCFIKTQSTHGIVICQTIPLPETEKNDRAKAGILAGEPQCNLIAVLLKGSTL